MPLQKKDITTSITDACEQYPRICSIMGNPFWTALLVAVIVFIVMNLICHDSPIKSITRTSFYTFFLFLGILFIHDTTLIAECRKTFDKVTKPESFSPTRSAMYGGNSSPFEYLSVNNDNIPVEIPVRNNFASLII